MLVADAMTLGPATVTPNASAAFDRPVAELMTGRPATVSPDEPFSRITLVLATRARRAAFTSRLVRGKRP